MMIWSKFTIHLILGALVGLVSAWMARRRNKNPIPWFFVGFFLGFYGLLLFYLYRNNQQKKRTAPSTKPVPQPYLAGPTDKFWYYLDPDNRQVGPMSHSAITNEWKQGKISPDTYVWHEDLSNWSPLQELILTTTRNP